MKIIRIFLFCLILGIGDTVAYTQTYYPVSLTGYNNDCVAESGTNAVAVTSTGLDLQDKLLYSTDFATTNGILGGIPSSGFISDGTRNFQMNYSSSNCLYMSNNAPNATTSGTLSLASPGSFTKLSLLTFSTQGTSTISIILNFTDGSTQNVANTTMSDWFYNTTSSPQVVTNFGRIIRQSAGPYTPDGVPNGNPKMYAIDINVSCILQAKTLQSISFGYVSGSTVDSRIVILALSGVNYSTINTTPTITAATCGSSNGSISLNITGGASPFSYNWNSTPPQYTATASNLPGGTYSCTITDANGCTAGVYNGTVTQSSSTTLTATASHSTICSDSSSTLTATATGGTVSNYLWSPGGATTPVVTVSPATTTTYTVSAQDAGGCNLTASVIVTVNPTPTANFTATPSIICLGTADTLTYTGIASSSATYNWNNFAGATVLNGIGNGPYQIKFNSAGTYTLQLNVLDNNCPSSAYTQTVVVSSPPSTNFMVSSSAICSGQTVSVNYTSTPTSTATPTWTWGGGTIQSGSSFGPYNVLYNTSGSIILTITDGACTATSAPTAITVTPMPVASFTIDTSKGCLPFVVTFTNTSQNGITYLWDFNDGSTSTNATPSSHTFSLPATYNVTLTATQGSCSNTTSPPTSILVKQQPVASFQGNPNTNSPIQLNFANFIFTNNSNYSTNYIWAFGDGDTSLITSPTHKYNSPGLFTVTLYALNDIGCIDSTSKYPFVVIPDSTLKIPNAFTPNGDGINETWVIDGLKGYPDARVDIFNRWGQEVFSSHGYLSPWDGTYHGKPLPIGTFYYIIVANSKKYSGWVVLLR